MLKLLEAAAMRIGELGERAGVSAKTIRYYEEIGLLPEPTRLPSGYRAYTDDDAARLAFIKSAQRLGLALDEIKEILALRDEGLRPCGHVRDVLRREVAELDGRIRDLRRLAPGAAAPRHASQRPRQADPCSRSRRDDLSADRARSRARAPGTLS